MKQLNEVKKLTKNKEIKWQLNENNTFQGKEKYSSYYMTLRCFSGAISRRHIVYMSVVFNFSVYSYLQLNERPS